jgi:hypothetical protein
MHSSCTILQAHALILRLHTEAHALILRLHTEA